MRQTACLVFNTIMVEGYAAHFSCTAGVQDSPSMTASMTLYLHAGGSGVGLHDGPDLKLFILVGWDRSFRLLLGPPGLN